MQARTSSKANAGAGRPGPRPRGVRLLILAVLLVALVLAGGCGGGDEGATSDENTTTTSDAATTSETEGDESHEASRDTMAPRRKVTSCTSKPDAVGVTVRTQRVPRSARHCPVTARRS